MGLGCVPQARHFPRRNRIVAGLALGTVVIEAAVRSGSLITARLAGEHGREVMAVPGLAPWTPRCRGANQLIRQGAILVESAADIDELLAGLAGPAKADYIFDNSGLSNISEAAPETPGNARPAGRRGPVARSSAAWGRVRCRLTNCSAVSIVSPFFADDAAGA